MCRFRAFFRLIVVCLMLVGFNIHASASYKIRIPHSIEWVCEESEEPNGGSYGVRLIWGDYPGAESFQIISRHPALGGGTVNGDVNSWGIGGGSPVHIGECPEKEAQSNPPKYQKFYEVWAVFPEGGNLELHKTDNVYGAARPGDEIRYFLIYKNTGKYSLDDCIVQETWPPYMEYVAGGNPNGPNSVTWNFGTVNPGHWRQVELVLRISEALPRTITEIHNVAVVHPVPSATPTPGGPGSGTTSPPVGFGVSHCDALRCNVAYGTVEWIDRPDSSDWADLVPYEVVRGGDDVRVDSGYTSFNHTVATGTLLLFDGGFALTGCPDLEDNVLSEITLTTPASIEHTVSGILSPDEFVRVVGQLITMEIQEGRYTYIGGTAEETVEVETGHVTVIDPDGTRHNLSAGTTYVWPPVIGDMARLGDGPKLVDTDPADFGSIRFTVVNLTYQFDEPVTSVGSDSSFCLGATAGVWQGCGTLEDLAATTPVSVAWNTESDALTISFPGTYVWLGRQLQGGETVVSTLHLTDVVGASGTTDDIYQTMTLFVTQQTSSQGHVNCQFDYFGFDTQADGLLSVYGEWDLNQLTELPGPLPQGMHQASPVYEFEFLGTVLDRYWLQLRPSLSDGLPQSETGGGIYSWNGATWDLLREGFGLDWTWTTALTDPHQILVLLTEWDRPEMPEIVSIYPGVENGPVAGDTPLVITVSSPSGIRAEFAQININGARTLSYDPITMTVEGWSMEESNGITTFTYVPASNWQEAQLVYGTYYLPARYGLIPVEGQFNFAVAYSDTTDGDGDGMHDAWENANGTNPAVNDRDSDPDGDSFSNWTEFIYLSNPSSSISLPAFPGINLYSNQEAYFEGDNLVCKTRISNGPVATPVDLYIVLELEGAFYSWPTYGTDIQPMSFTLPENINVSLELLAFPWEEIPGELEITWYGAFLGQGTTMLYSFDAYSMLLN